MTPSQAFSVIDQATEPRFVPSKESGKQVLEALAVIARRLELADKLEAEAKQPKTVTDPCEQ